jgi:hypothetical protein
MASLAKQPLYLGDIEVRSLSSRERRSSSIRATFPKQGQKQRARNGDIDPIDGYRIGGEPRWLAQLQGLHLGARELQHSPLTPGESGFQGFGRGVARRPPADQTALGLDGRPRQSRTRRTDGDPSFRQ